MADYNKDSSSSESEGEQQTTAITIKIQEQGTRRKRSKQLQYYYRKTADKTKRKYTPFADQENPCKQLKRYHVVTDTVRAVVPTEHELLQNNSDQDDNDGKDTDDENDNIDPDDELEGVLDYNEEEGSELSIIV